MTKETGGPAFPVQSVYIEDQETNSSGMTLRDHFAGLAMQALLVKDGTVVEWFPNRAKEAYMMADAMLEARK